MIYWFHHITSLGNPFELASFYATHVFSEQIQAVFIDALLILALHGYCILLLTQLFKRFVVNAAISKNYRTSFLLYLVAILLVMIAHCNDILILALALDSLKVFADPLTTFYYVGGMYTTIGSSANPGVQWQGISIIISFTGVLAFSVSGAGLYSMLGYFLASSKGTDPHP